MRPISAITLNGLVPSGDPGAACDLQWVAIEKLVCDDDYQRAISATGRAAIRKIAENFRWRFFTPVVVSPVPGGVYAIIDGQHRVTAAASIGIPMVPCSVVMASAQEQASAFKTINNSATRLFPYQIYRAALAAGEERAMKLARLCDEAGVVIQTPGTAKRPDGTLCVWNIAKHVDQYGAPAVIAALKCLKACAVEGETWLRSSPIASVCAVLADHPEWVSQATRLVSVFEEIDMSRMWEMAVTMALRSPGTGNSNQLQALLVEKLMKKMMQAAA